MAGVSVLEGHKDRVWHVCWTHTGETLASCGGDKTVRLWQRKPTLAAGEEGGDDGTATASGGDAEYLCAETLEGTHTKTIRRCEFSTCDTMIASVSFDATTCVWDKTSQGEWDLVVTLEGHESEVKNLAWSPCGELLATCGRDKSIWIWLKEIDDQFECLDVLQGHTQDIKSLVWVPGTRALVSASYDNTIRVWNEVSDEWLCTQTLDGSYQGHETTVWGLACDARGERVLSCDGEGMILLWSTEISAEDKSVELGLVSRNKVPSASAVYSIDWSPSGMVAIGSANNSICLLQVERDGDGETEGEGREVLRLVREITEAHHGDVNCVRFNPTRPALLASGGDDETVKVWNLDEVI